VDTVHGKIASMRSINASSVVAELPSAIPVRCAVWAAGPDSLGDGPLGAGARQSRSVAADGVCRVLR
jgi:hypothetical protein